MSERRKMLPEAAIAVLSILSLILIGCDFFEKPGGSMAVPMTRGIPEDLPRGEYRPCAQRAAISGWPAPIRGNPVQGAGLPGVRGFEGEFTLGRGVTYGPVTIFPVLSEEQQDNGARYISLARARSEGLAEIREAENGASIHEIQIRNRSDMTIYVMSGDVIRGGNQDRVISTDLVIAPRETRQISGSVYCVESGRWSPGETGGQFDCEQHACVNLRKSLVQSSISQSEVWLKVGEINACFGTQSSSGSYTRAFGESALSTRVEAYMREFMRDFRNDRDTVGYVACVESRVVACDIFFSSTLLAEMRERLLKSYIMGIMSMEERPGRAGVSARDVVKFFENASTATAAAENPVPGCEVCRFSGSEIEGYWNKVDGKTIHLFAAAR